METSDRCVSYYMRLAAIIAACFIALSLLCNKAAAGDEFVIFPSLVAKDLNGKTVSVPSDLPGKPLILIATFDRDQQDEATRVIKLIKDASTELPHLNYYQIPVIKANAALRFLISSGMRSSIREPQARAHVITLYTDVQAWTQQVRIPTTDRVYLLSLNSGGQIIASQPASQIRTKQDLVRLLGPVEIKGSNRHQNRQTDDQTSASSQLAAQTAYILRIIFGSRYNPGPGV